MKKAWRKLYSKELLYDYIMFGLLVLVWAGFLLYQTIKIADGTVLIDRGTRFIGFSAAVLIAIIFLAGISLYKKSMSYIRWYKDILDSVPMPVIVTDEDARLQHVNKAARETLNLKQVTDIESLNSRHLIGEDGGVMEKVWVHRGKEYRISGNRLCCGNHDAGYLIFLNNTHRAYETRDELINEINRLFGRLGAVNDHFHDCANTLSQYTVQQAGIITELSDVIAGIASGTLGEPDALNEKIHTVRTDMRQYMESSHIHMEKMRQSTKEMESVRNCIGSVMRDINRVP